MTHATATPSARHWAVYPSAQWRREYPHLPPVFYWKHRRHAYESAYDTDGFVVMFYGTNNQARDF